MKLKKAIKILLGIVVFFTLPSLLFLGYLYIKYDEPIPVGVQGEKADALATKMLDALDFESYTNTNYIEWTFRNKRHYKWEKDKNICTVYWKEYKVVLTLDDYTQSTTYVHNFRVTDDRHQELINDAVKYFKHDCFWLTAPYTILDKNTERYIVTHNNEDALLVTYKDNSPYTNDSFLWILDSQGKPKSVKIWSSLMPLKGIEATWSNWITTESGAILPSHHNLLFFSFNLGDVKATN